MQILLEVYIVLKEMNLQRMVENFALNNSTSFKYKVSRLGKATVADGNDRSLKNKEIVFPLKYLSNLFSSLECL